MDEIANAYCYNRYRNDYAEAQRWYKKAAEKAIRMQWTKSQEYIDIAMEKKMRPKQKDGVNAPKKHMSNHVE